jgi:ceramide synthetase
MWRIGSTVMMLHDANDVLMEAAKLAKYCKKETLSLGLFATFAVAWLGLRLLYFPLMVIRSTLYEMPGALNGKPPVYYVLNGLLMMLFLLHCYWFTLIMRVIYVTLTTGQTQDVREDDD